MLDSAQIETDKTSIHSVGDTKYSQNPDNMTIVKSSGDLLHQTIGRHFDEEIDYKKAELNSIDERIFSAQNKLDKLRVCIICKFYSNDGKLNAEDFKNHPVVRKLKCEHIEAFVKDKFEKSSKDIDSLTSKPESLMTSSIPSNPQLQNLTISNIKIKVGNVSKYLKNSTNLDCSEQIEASQYNQDLITHKWMVYIRSANCKNLENYIKKVIFYLHPSYKPYDIVQVKSAPFQLIKRGWGEFPIHVQIHFKDQRNKRIDINHLLKLDWTQTGLQTFGGETVKECQLAIKPNDFISTSASSARVDNSHTDQCSTETKVQSTLLNDYTPQNETIESKSFNSGQNFLEQTHLPRNAWHKEDLEMDSQIAENSDGVSPIEFAFSPSEISHSTQTKRDQTSSSSDLSPSDFISTNILDSPVGSDKKMEIDILKPNFDDLIHNFYSINTDKPTIDNNNNVKSKRASSGAEYKSDILSKEISCAPESQFKSVSVDALLNLRPKSIISITPPPRISSTTGISTSEISSPLASFNRVGSVIKTTQLLANDSAKNQFKPSIMSTRKLTHTASDLNLNARDILQQDSFNSFSISTPKATCFEKNKTLSSIVSECESKRRNVIYKIESSDALTTKSSNSISKSSNSNLISGVDLVTTSEANKNQLPSFPYGSNNQKKLKLAPCQITKVKAANNNEICSEISTIQVDHAKKNKGQMPNSIFLKERDSKKVLKIKASSVNQELSTCFSSTLDIYSSEYLKQLIKKQSKPMTFESCLKIAVKQNPIILSNPSQIVENELPYWANSIHEFYSWSYAKRKAHEWMRALCLKRKSVKLMKEINNLTYSDPIWSTKKIALWLRSNGHTPLEFQHMIPVNRRSKISILNQNYINSFTPINHLDWLTRKESFEMNRSARNIKEETELLDVVGSAHEALNGKLTTNISASENTFQTNTMGPIKHIELCEGGKYVKEQLDLLKIKTSRSFLQSSHGSPRESETYTCDLVERFIFLICRRFADDLIRKCCSDNYFEPLSASHTETTIVNQNFPCYLNVAQVFTTIIKHPTYQFLTNNYMAKEDKSNVNTKLTEQKDKEIKTILS